MSFFCQDKKHQFFNEAYVKKSKICSYVILSKKYKKNITNTIVHCALCIVH